MIIKACGIYKITNVITGDYYIGSSINMASRARCHAKQLDANIHANRHLQNAYNKYGKQAFEYSTILICDLINKLYYEQLLLDALKPAYNIAICAKANMQGRHHTEETRRNLSEYAMSEENRIRSIEAGKSKQMTEEMKRQAREAHKGCRHTEETRRRISEANKGELNPNFGNKPSEETKRKMREMNKGELNPFFGQHHSEETRAKISRAHKGERNCNFGKHLSDDVRAKISKTRKDRYCSIVIEP